jgi:hypothetical protein
MVAAGAVAPAAVATPSAAAAASACTPAGTQSAVRSFVADFNGGNFGHLDALFAQRPAFGWYSSNPPGLRNAAAAKNRGSLIAYFRARHAKRDRLQLVSFKFTGNAQGHGNFTFAMKRSAADYRKGAWFSLVGKGAVVCSKSRSPYVEELPVRFIVLSLGGPGSAGR